MRLISYIAAHILLVLSSTGQAGRPTSETNYLVALYEHLHASPELSFQEQATSAHIARELGDIGFRVTTGVGGFGVVALLENGAGPTLILRADMDALPVQEQTGLYYASTARPNRSVQ
jgi:metal-dependent amidase/aminoacylase/carboxypeptidase family protein